MTVEQSGRPLAAVLGLSLAALGLPAMLVAMPVSSHAPASQVVFAGAPVDGYHCPETMDLLEFDTVWECDGATIEVRELSVPDHQADLALRRTVRLHYGGGPLPGAPMLSLAQGSFLPQPQLIGLQVGDHYAVVAGPDCVDIAVALWETATGNDLTADATRQLEAV